MTDLVHNFLILQQTLYKKNSDTARILTEESERKTCESDEEIPSDYENDDGGNYEQDANDEKKDDVEESLYLPRKRKKSMVRNRED